MATRSWICVLILSLPTPSWGVEADGDARASGMALAGIALRDPWSVNNNVAGLSDLKQPVLGSHVQNVYTSLVTRQSLFFAFPAEHSVWALSWHQFGYLHYRENTFGISVAKQLSKELSIGAKVNYFQLQQRQPYGSTGIWIGEAGFLYSISKSFEVAVHLYNPNQTKLNQHVKDRVPSRLRSGFAYKPSKSVLLSSEVEKISTLQPQFKLGVEYHPSKNLAIRVGINTSIPKHAIGVGYQFQNMQIDLSTNWHTNAPASFQFNFALLLNRFYKYK